MLVVCAPSGVLKIAFPSRDVQRMSQINPEIVQEVSFVDMGKVLTGNWEG
jgi:hypothetical protein